MITDRKIKHLIDNSLVVDHESRCKLCNGPTLHRPDANLGHRCFHFPRCSGQAGLFGDVRTSYVFLDFETSGLAVQRDSIIEIGALKIDDEGYEHVFQKFIKPPEPIGAHITQITGITNDMLENAPPLSDVIRDFIAFVGDAKLVAHNAEFDIPWLIRSILENDLPLPQNGVICTLKWARRAKEPRAGLGALTKKYKIVHHNAHRALADACSTRELFLIFENQYGSEKMEESLAHYQGFAEKILQQN
jgi:DNA polymerase-3 subunit alpha (Gram-positive type)